MLGNVICISYEKQNKFTQIKANRKYTQHARRISKSHRITAQDEEVILTDPVNL
jgi:hypothetical protein